MTRQAAKKLVCEAAAQILEESDTSWMHFTSSESGVYDEPLPEADTARLKAAFEELLEELWRRGS